MNNTYNTIAPVDQAATTTSKSHWRQSKGRKGLLALGASGMALAFAAPALAAGAPAAAPASTVSEVIVNGIPYKETVLPTRLSVTSTLGLKLNVMDTPRSTTLLSTTQLETLNIQDARAFSYLTSSSYTDSAFGTPNIPRIRGQYGDVYYNGMRDSFSQNGYGAPINFDAFQNIAITKGPPAVMDGPSPNVGGEVNMLTKRPNMSSPTETFDATFDTLGTNRWMVDIGGPISPGDLAFRISYSGEYSDNTYFTDHYMRKEAVYAALRWKPNDKYTLDFNTELNSEKYTEEVGVNRGNQQLIDSGSYLQGTYEAPGFDFGNIVDLVDNGVKLSPHVTLDEVPGVSTNALLFNAQLIQTYDFNANLSLENNTFFAFQNSDNQEPYYYSDASRGSYSIENRTTLNGENTFNFANTSIDSQYVIGGSFRLAHTNYIANFDAEPVSIYDLTGNPSTWVIPGGHGEFADDSFPFQSSFGHTLYGVPGRDSVNAGDTGISDLYDVGLFFQDRLEFSPQFSFLFGSRIDAVWNHTTDPLGGPTCATCNFGDGSILPQSHSTGVYGLGELNTSFVYKPYPWLSTYITFDWTQSTAVPNGGEGGLNTYNFSLLPASSPLHQLSDGFLLRQNNYLYEAGMKANLFDNKLFIGWAVFDQKRHISVLPAPSIPVDIRGTEIEFNYQPNRNIFVTASYSYLNTVLGQAIPFYDFPAAPGVNIDGGGNSAVFLPNQTYRDPGVPEHLLNFLANYKFNNGLGLRTGVQVTGPITTSTSGNIDLVATRANIVSNELFGYDPGGSLLPTGPGGSIKVNPSNPNIGYYTSPVIPWQYTWNAAVYYEYKQYTVTLSVYNITDRRNWSPSFPYYGNDFLVLSDPRTFELRLQAKF